MMQSNRKEPPEPDAPGTERAAPEPPKAQAPADSPAPSKSDSNGRLSGRVSVEQARIVSNILPKEVPIDVNYIETVALTEGLAGRNEVEKYFGDEMDFANSDMLGKTQRTAALVAEDEKVAAQKVESISVELDNLPRYVKKEEYGVPWTPLPRIKFFVLLIFSLVLLAIGINTTASILQASGLSGFELFWRAALFSAIAPFIAVILELIGDLFDTPKARKTYRGAVLVAALGLGIVWVITFAELFPGLGQTISQIVQDLASAQGDDEQRRLLERFFICVSLLAESFMAASCWLTMEAIAERHEPPGCQDNPSHKKVEADLQEWMNHRQQLSDLLGSLNWKLEGYTRLKANVIRKALAKFDAFLAESDHRKQRQSQLQNVLKGS